MYILSSPHLPVGKAIVPDRATSYCTKHCYTSLFSEDGILEHQSSTHVAGRWNVYNVMSKSTKTSRPKRLRDVEATVSVFCLGYFPPVLRPFSDGIDNVQAPVRFSETQVYNRLECIYIYVCVEV